MVIYKHKNKTYQIVIKDEEGREEQILRDFNSDDTIRFFGDAMSEGGNDYPLGKLLQSPSKAYAVDNWSHTWNYLKEMI